MTNLLEFDHVHYAYPNCPESLAGVTFTVQKEPGLHWSARTVREDHPAPDVQRDS